MTYEVMATDCAGMIRHHVLHFSDIPLCEDLTAAVDKWKANLPGGVEWVTETKPARPVFEALFLVAESRNHMSIVYSVVDQIRDSRVAKDRLNQIQQAALNCQTSLKKIEEILMTMKPVATALLMLTCLFVSSLRAQPPVVNNIGATGLSWQPGGSIAGTGLYARRITGEGTFAFTVLDAFPTKTKPFAVTTATSAGIAQKVLSLGNVSVFIPTAAGISYSGTSTGWSYTSGVMAVMPVGSASAWRILPNVRVIKSSVSGDPYQLVGGLMIGWGWK